MARKTRRTPGLKEETDFLSGASAKAPRTVRKTKGADSPAIDRKTNTDISAANRNGRNAQIEHKKADATLASLQARILEDFGPKALNEIAAVLDDKDGKYSPEHKQKLAFQVLGQLGLNKVEPQSGNQRMDLATLQAASDRLARILAKAEAPDVAHDPASLFG